MSDPRKVAIALEVRAAMAAHRKGKSLGFPERNRSEAGKR